MLRKPGKALDGFNSARAPRALDGLKKPYWTMHKKNILFLAIGAFCVVLYLSFKPKPVPVQPEQSGRQEAQGSLEPAPVKPVQPTLEQNPSLAPIKALIPAKTLIERIAAGDTNAYHLSPEQVQAFLARNQTNGEALLAAFNVSGDLEFLREAARRYPKDPFVLASVLGSDALPEHRRELLDQFKQVSPDNPLANYFAAREDLRNKQPGQALKEMAEASSKSGFGDFTIERAQGLEELYLSAGHSPAEAKALATIGVQEPSLPALRDIAAGLSALERQYAAAGDTASAELIARQGLALSANIANAGTRSLATQLLADSVQRDFLTPLNPQGSYSFLQQPVSDRLMQLQQDRQSVLNGMQFYNNWLATANEAQLIPYFDRVRLYGEAAAMNWARTQTGDSSHR